MPEQTTAPIVDITLGSTTFKILMGFRAYKKIGINPFKMEEMRAYLDGLDPDRAAQFLEAGIENAAIVLEIDQKITAEEVLNKLDMITFSVALAAINRAVGTRQKEIQASSEEIPMIAQTGSKSGPSGVN